MGGPHDDSVFDDIQESKTLYCEECEKDVDELFSDGMCQECYDNEENGR